MSRSKTSNDQTAGGVIILVAPSGSGKTTIARRLLQDFDRLRFSVSATTRAQRPGERNGIDYHFLDRGTFLRYIHQKKFIEWEEFYNGKYYGTLGEEVENKLKSGYYVLFDVEVKGAVNLKKHYGNRSLAIFIKPPSLEILKQRLINRKSDAQSSIEERLERAKMEMEFENRFDYVVVNDDLEKAYHAIKKIVNDYMKQTHPLSNQS